MFKKAKSFFTGENFIASMMGFSTLNDWANSKGGKIVLEKITGKLFGIGPDDEALFKKACSFLISNILKFDIESKQAATVILKINVFLYEMDRRGFSRWWLRNVLAAMRKGDAPGENQAARTLAEIIQGNSFEEMSLRAGPDLMHKTYLRKAKDVYWELVESPDGKINLLVDFSKIKNFVPSFQKAKEEFNAGVKSQFWPALIAFVIFCILMTALVHC